MKLYQNVKTYFRRTMPCLRQWILLFGIAALSYGMKVNMDGKLSLGKDVIDTLTQFLGMTFTSGRRAMFSVADEDPITSIVRAAFICNDLTFCKELKKFLEEYLIVLAKTVDNILMSSLGSKYKSSIYETQLKYYLDNIKDITVSANEHYNEFSEIYSWTNTIKEINAKFEELASIFTKEMDAGVESKESLELHQRLMIAAVILEAKYLNKLCTDHEFCAKSFAVTKGLNVILGQLKTMSEDKNRIFVKVFYEVIFDTPFYSQISESMAHQLQIILNDMAYSSHVPTKELLLSVHKIIETRLELLKMNKVEKMSHDAHLLHAILSDMDHIYSAHTPGVFNDFEAHFFNWVKHDVPLNKPMRDIIDVIRKEVSNVTEDLLTKIISEVKVFLELTIESK